MLTRLGLVLALLLSGCVHDNSVPLPFMAAPAAAPTPADWNTALKGVVLNTGGVDCLQVRRANVDDCSKEKRFNLYCVDENDPASVFGDDTPKGCGVLYMKTLATCGDQIPAGLQLKCRLDTEVPQATPSPSPTVRPTQSPRPTQTPIDTNQYCVNRDPSWCWHVDSRLVGNDCWANCLCVRRSVGPCAGVSTPKPTVKPTATPPPVSTPAPTQTPTDITDRCRAGDPQYCWDKDSIINAFGECFSNCTCLRKPNSNCRVAPTQTPRATATPGPTATARPTNVPTPSPGVQCPAGQHAVWSCEPDATLTPAPVVTTRPSPAPSAGARVIAGGWFIPECTAVNASGTRQRWYDFPYVFAAYGKGFNKHVTDFKEPCTPNAEVWNATIAIPNHWNNTDEANIEIAKQQMPATITAIRERKQQIATLRAQGVPEAKLPKMPILWVGETSTGAWGYSQDLWQGGFYKTVNGRRTLKTGAEMSSPFPKYIEFMISEYQKEGVTEFADAPYTFFWANREFNTALSASRMTRTDQRGRELAVPRDPQMLRAYTAAQKRSIVEGNHPEVWPKGYKWQSNDAINVSAEGHSGLDIPDAAALKRDSTYYTYYVLAMRAHHPEVTRIIPQLSNCVYNRSADSPHWAIAAQMVGVNRAFGLQPDIQIEGCDGHANELAGKPWNTPLADCVALKAIQKAPNPIISMWAADIKGGLALDYSGCK